MNAYPLSSTANTHGQPAWHTPSQLARASLTAACGVALTLAAWVVMVMLLEHRFRAYDGLVWSGSLWLSALVCTGGVAYSRFAVRPVWACSIAFALFGLTYMACEGPIFGAVSEGGDPSMTQFVVLNLALLPLGVFAATDIGLWLGRRHRHNKPDEQCDSRETLPQSDLT